MMDKKEAADLLDTLIGMIEDSGGRDYDTALRMAINALSAGGDIIYRQAAIDVLNKLARDNFTLRDAFSFYLGALHDAADGIKALPSAQPEVTEEAVKEYCRKRCLCIVDSALLKKYESAQPERLTDDDFETIRIHLNAYKEKLCNQQRWKDAEEYQRIIDRFMAFASAQSEPIRINLNEPIKVKLTDWGKEIYYRQYDRTNQIAGREICKPRFPREDENGYTEFQLWGFIELYGTHIGMTLPNVIEPLEIVYEGEINARIH